MSLDIKYIKDTEGNNYFPVVHEKGVVDDNGTTLESKLQSKQDAISDLSTIRSGATAGSTAIQSVTIGTTTTGAAGTNASVTNTGTATAPVLSFTIPQGAQGIQGIQGPQGERGPQGNTGVQVDSVASIIHSIDPTATYAAADVAGADAVQDVLSEVTELGGEIDKWDIVSPSTISSGWALTGVNGLCTANNSASLVKYQVTAGTRMWLKLSKDNGGVYQWQNNASVGSQSNNYLIGSPVTTATDGEVTVPTGATYLIVSQNNSNTTNEVSVYSGSQIQQNKEDIAALNEQIVNTTDTNTSDLWSQGYYGVDNGSSHNANDYIRTSNLPTDVDNIEAINTFWYYLQAWEGSTFKGTWNGSAFSTSSYLKQTSTDLDAMRTSYPSYSFRLSVRNEADTSITPSTDYVNIKLYRNDYLTERVSAIEESIGDIESSIDSLSKLISEELYIGELAVGSHDQYGFKTGYPTRVCMKNVIMFPRRRVKYRVSINTAYQTSFEFGVYASDMTHGIGSWLSDGDEFTLPENYNLYIASFKKVNDGEIFSSEIPDINPHFYAVDYEPYDIRECVSESENVFQNAMYDYGNHGYSYGLDDNGSDFVAIAHATDIHSDRQRLKDCYDIVMKEKNITAMCITGDTNNDVIQNGFGWLHELVNDYYAKGVDSAFCFGNHEVYSRSSVSISNSDAYNMVMQPMATAIGNTGTDCYYYRDFTSKKIRIISLNLYEDYGATGITRQYPHWSQTQVDWFISTLLSTPANYGVVILMHAPFVRPQKVEGKGDFYQDVVSTSTPTEYSDNPIYEIVDAFISRTTLSKSYSQDGTPSTLSVNADFASVNSGVEFIAYLCGHTHSELVGYAKGQTNTQLVLLSPCLASDYFHGNVQFWQANSSDVARNPNNVSGTVMNVYVIDRIHKTVRIVRFGNTWTYDMKRRLYMEIPYAT